MQKSLKGTWFQAITAFLLPIFILGFIRWAVFEPFVIPSGSMIPNLLVHDHVIVKKFSYGLKFPFTDIWIVRWAEPQRGEVVVFKYPKNQSVYYIKRLIGVPGDEVHFKDGLIKVNGQEWTMTPTAPPDDIDADGFAYFKESSGPETHIVRYRDEDLQSKEEYSIKLKDGEYFMMGDNRDESMDSRYWGTVPAGLLVAPAWRILLGCEETLASNSMLCDPSTLKMNRFWRRVSP